MRGAGAPAALIVVAGLLLAACASRPSPGSHPTARGGAHPHGAPAARPEIGEASPFSLAPPSRRTGGRPVASLPGWAEEDHLAALAAFQAGCGASRDPAARALCGYARSLRAPDDGAARVFFENNFRAESVPETPGVTGVLTAYFAPQYEARATPDEVFSAPVRPKPRRGVETAAAAAPPADPDDIIATVLSEAEPAAPARTIDLATADRATIDRSAPDGALAWMRPEDLFFLQIQGSGVLSFPDGRRMKATYAGDNGKPFVAIARPMVNQGLLGNSGASGENIRGWLAAHRGPEAEKVMWLNPRYVFFALADDDGREPPGAAGVPLPAGRAIAVDPSRHAYGELFWIDAEAPVLAGAAKTYRRLAMALDTGAAIRGQVRADLYIGSGAAAGLEAGRVRHNLKMTRLVPIGPGERHETIASTGGD